jgi:hypothetical protein
MGVIYGAPHATRQLTGRLGLWAGLRRPGRHQAAERNAPKRAY